MFSKGCKVVDCDLSCSAGELPPEIYSSVVNKPLSLSSSSLQGVVSNVLGYVGTEDVGQSKATLDEIMGVDPETPSVESSFEADLAADLDEQAWTKVGNTIKNRKKLK